MTQAKPQMNPGGNNTAASGSARAAKAAAPNASLPAAVAGAASGDCGCAGKASAAAPGAAPAGMASGGAQSAPTLRPSGGGGAGVTAWQNDKRITALWSINQHRNSWAHVDGIGWKKLADNSDSAIVALSVLSAHAYEKGSIVYYREEADGMIREMYVW